MARIDRRVTERIFTEIHNKGEIDKDYVVQLLKTYDEAPDKNKLVEQYWGAKANRIISKFKDDNHVRDCFAVKERDKTTYVNISTTDKVYYVKDVVGTLKKQIDGRRRSMQKAVKRVSILEGQVGLADYENQKIAK